MLMTTEDFRTKAELGPRTTEGPGIKAVQQALTAYHGAEPGSTEQTQALTAVDTAVRAWRKKHTPSTNVTHKSRERGKRRAMDELDWQVEATLVDEERSLVMSRDAFRQLAGLGKWTVEGEKIKAVQTKLVRYHDAVGDQAKSDALLELQAAISTWRTAHVAPLNLGGRSSRKMQVMDQLQWQVAMLTNEGVSEVLEDPTGIAAKLREQVVVVHETGDATANKLRQLMGKLASHYADYIKTHQDPRGATAVRIATVDIATWDLVRLVTDKCPLGSDGIDDGTQEPPVMSYDPGTQEILLGYLKSLLSNEMREQTRVALTAGALSDKHSVQIIVDYYFARSTDQISLHKDTYGSTLFVALHYLNKGEMTGPEFIYDRWPIAAREPYNHLGVDIDENAWAKSRDTKKARPRAPWSKNAKYDGYGVADGAFEVQRNLDMAATHFWPHELIGALQTARATLPDDTDMQMSELHPYGLISFVDELIYHSTPLKRRRGEDDTEEKSSFRNVTTGGLQFYVGVEGEDKAPMTLSRRMSVALSEGDFEPKTGFKDKRTFLRLWITVTPKSWYKPWGTWKMR